MPSIKEAVIVIFAAAAIIILAITPAASLAEDGAQSISSAETTDNGERGFEGEEEMSGIVGIIAPLIKIAMFMGVPALITLAVLRLTRRRKRQVRAGPVAGSA